MLEIAIAIAAFAWVLLDTLWKMYISRKVTSWENDWDTPAEKDAANEDPLYTNWVN